MTRTHLCPFLFFSPYQPRISNKVVVANVRKYMGIYPSVNVSVHTHSGRPMDAAAHQDLAQRFPEVVNFMRDSEASASLYVIPRESPCFRRMNTRVANRQLEKVDLGLPPQPFRLDELAAIFPNTAFHHAVHAPVAGAVSNGLQAVAIVADYQRPDRTYVRRFGIVCHVVELLEKGTASDGPLTFIHPDSPWTVIWDGDKCFGHLARCQTYLGFVDRDAAAGHRGHAGAKKRSRTAVDEGEDRRNILALTWACKKVVGPISWENPRQFDECYLVTMMGKEQENYQEVKLTREERMYLGLETP